MGGGEEGQKLPIWRSIIYGKPHVAFFLPSWGPVSQDLSGVAISYAFLLWPPPGLPLSPLISLGSRIIDSIKVLVHVITVVCVLVRFILVSRAIILVICKRFVCILNIQQCYVALNNLSQEIGHSKVFSNFDNFHSPMVLQFVAASTSMYILCGR